MRIRIIVLAFICLSFAACGSEAVENKPEIVKAAPSSSSNANTYVAIKRPTNAANAFSPNGNIRVASPVTTANAKRLSYSAPDNSQYAVEMGGSGLPVEKRTFANDKYIAKVVRLWVDASKKTISIYLKSGKVVAVAGDKWPDIKSQSVTAFYEAAGIKITQNPPAELKKKN